jgi:hypothetical protein
MVEQEEDNPMPTEPEVLTTAEENLSDEKEGCCVLQVVGWLSVGIAVAALGLFAGLELRNRYRFQHRTPYDFYANAGEQQASEFGLGV